MTQVVESHAEKQFKRLKDATRSANPAFAVAASIIASLPTNGDRIRPNLQMQLDLKEQKPVEGEEDDVKKDDDEGEESGDGFVEDENEEQQDVVDNDSDVDHDYKVANGKKKTVRITFEFVASANIP